MRRHPHLPPQPAVSLMEGRRPLKHKKNGGEWWGEWKYITLLYTQTRWGNHPEVQLLSPPPAPITPTCLIAKNGAKETTDPENTSKDDGDEGGGGGAAFETRAGGKRRGSTEVLEKNQGSPKCASLHDIKAEHSSRFIEAFSSFEVTWSREISKCTILLEWQSTSEKDLTRAASD